MNVRREGSKYIPLVSPRGVDQIFTPNTINLLVASKIFTLVQQKIKKIFYLATLGTVGTSGPQVILMPKGMLGTMTVVITKRSALMLPRGTRLRRGAKLADL